MCRQLYNRPRLLCLTGQMSYPLDTTPCLVALACGCSLKEVSASFGGSPAGWHWRFDCATKKKKAKYYEANKEARIEAAKKRYRENPDRKRVCDISRKYGLTKEEAASVLTVTSCQICGSVLTSGTTKTSRVVDHCHGTNRFRGVLCSSCNIGLGLFKDNPAALRSAATYLEKAHDQ